MDIIYHYPGMDASAIHIIVVERPDLYRLGLRVLLGKHARISLVAETDNLDDLFLLVPNFESNIILIDWALIDPQSEAHAACLAHAVSNSRVLIICETADDDTCQYARRLQAAGIIEKSQSSASLLEAIDAIHTGANWFGHDQAHNVSPPSDDKSASIRPSSISALLFAQLSDSERRVAYWAAQGLSSKEISLQLAITEKTVRNQLSIIYRKLGIKKKIQLCIESVRHNNFE